MESLANRLHSAAIHLLREVARADAAAGMSPARLSALSVIVYGGPLTMTALAAAERVSNATITSTVNGLMASGLVIRMRGGADARVVRVIATPEGAAVMSAARRRRLDLLDGLLAGASEGERAALTDAVGTLERVLGTGPH